jgi:asparagine synthase (glutamine-hydrolysing)
MCGFKTQARSSGVSTPSLKTSFHRGPDGFGSFISTNRQVSMEHWRLAVFDTSSAGNQPMSYGNRYVMVFNGAIYNFQELRAELKSIGEVFRSNSDTEVLLRLLVRYGKEAITRLNGIFSFVLLDEKSGYILAARDRFGVKPLYFSYSDSGGLLIASEIKQLTLSKPKINQVRLSQYLLDGVIDHSNQTLFRDIFQLRGGEILEATMDTSYRPHVRRWYTPEATETSFNQGDFDERLLASVGRQMQSDVPIGFCLSGGLDSAAVACVARHLAPAARLDSISAVFPGSTIDESKRIDVVTKHLDLQSHHVTVNPQEIFNLLPRLTRLHDEPLGSSSMIAQFRVMEKAQSLGIKVMLDGQGADEILGGYLSTFHYYDLEKGFASRGLARIREQIISRAYDRSFVLFRNSLTKKISNIFSDDLRAIYTDAQSETVKALALDEIRNVQDFLLLMTFGTSLPMLLHSEDRNSMGFGIEARVPFLDNEMADYCLGLPLHERMGLITTKKPLRQLLRNYGLDRYANSRIKIGFATPEKYWFRGNLNKRVAKEYFETVHNHPTLFDPILATRAFEQRMSGKVAWDFLIWKVIATGVWLTEFNFQT